MRSWHAPRSTFPRRLPMRPPTIWTCTASRPAGSLVESHAHHQPPCDDARIRRTSKEGTTMGLSIKLIGLVATGFTAAGLLCAPVAMASPEDDFVSAITNKGISWPGATPENMVEAGRGVCQDWSAGATLEQEVASLAPHLST